MSETCDLCHSSALEPVYRPMAGGRGITIHLCSDCGLVQNLPRAALLRRTAAVSSAADRANDGTARTEACLSLIRAQADLNACLRVLDVGSNGGAFARAMLSAAPN